MFLPTFSVRFWNFLAFWNAFDIWKRIAQVLQTKFLQIIFIQPVKRNLNFSYYLLRIGFFKTLQNLHIWNNMVKGFSKKNVMIIFGHFFANILRAFQWFPYAWESGKFPKNLGIREIPKCSWESGNLSKDPNESEDIWGILPISRHLGNFGNSPNAWESGKFLKYLGVWAIPQIPILLQSIIVVGSCNFGK